MASNWSPRFTITTSITNRLMEIEAARAVVEHTSLPPAVQAELRHHARVRATHYSTRIEGNRLTLAEAEQVISGQRAEFHGRERDVKEVRNYWNALLRVEAWAAQKLPLTEELVRRLHALVEKGPRAKPTPYRDGQNVIRDSGSGSLVYLPPEAKDVPTLMAELVQWVKHADKAGVPVPLIAGLVHYQFVTIHPYYDGNGRTARLLATYILHRGGYGLNGFFSLEEHHARDLTGYYNALVTHSHHNYYEGRANAEITPWLEYFVQTLAQVFVAAQEEAVRLSGEGVPTEPEAMRRLDARARVVLGLFSHSTRIKTPEVAQALGVSDRMARLLIQAWVHEGWLIVANPSNRARAYALAEGYRQFIGNSSAIPRRHR